MALYKARGGAGGADANGTRQLTIAKGLTASGLTTDYGEFWDDFSHAFTTAAFGWFPSAGGTGSVAVNGVNGTGGGIMRLSTGATAGSSQDELGLMGLIFPISSTRWYIAARLRVNTAIDAQAIVGYGLKNQAGTKTILMGAHGGGSTVNFTVQYDGNLVAGTFASLGVAIDTSFHVFEMWSVGDGKLHTRVDGAGTDINVTMASAPADYCYPTFWARNGTTAADRSQDDDWQLTLFPRI